MRKESIVRLLCFLVATSIGNLLHAQEEIGAPYNPDINYDSLINITDLIGFLPLFGDEFLPADDDLDSTNEIQSLYLSNDTLYLIPNGGFVILSSVSGSGSESEDIEYFFVDEDFDEVLDEMHWFECMGKCYKSNLDGFGKNLVSIMTYYLNQFWK
jgi:hypothetical protein